MRCGSLDVDIVNVTEGAEHPLVGQGEEVAPARQHGFRLALDEAIAGVDGDAVLGCWRASLGGRERVDEGLLGGDDTLGGGCLSTPGKEVACRVLACLSWL